MGQRQADTGMLDLKHCLLSFYTGVLFAAKYALGADLAKMQTLTMETLVFGGEATLYSLRERHRMWGSRPGRRVVIDSVANLLIISSLAVLGAAKNASGADRCHCRRAEPRHTARLRCGPDQGAGVSPASDHLMPFISI
jgi:hypothetical protein